MFVFMSASGLSIPILKKPEFLSLKKTKNPEKLGFQVF